MNEINDKPILRRLDIYRIADPIFRVHSRLYRVQHAITKAAQWNIKALKVSTIGYAVFIAAFLLSTITILINYFNQTWSSGPIIILYLIIGGSVFYFVVNIKSINKAEKDFAKLIEETGIEEDPESSFEYAKIVVAGFGTRLKMINDALVENKNLWKKGIISQEKHDAEEEYLIEIKKSCEERLNYYELKNENLYQKKKRKEEEYKELNRYFTIARKEV